MKILIILGHPKSGSFCHAIAGTAMETLRAGGHDVIVHDLYAEAFDPVFPEGELLKGPAQAPAIRQQCDELLAADGYVVVHPNWWAQPPAMLKGWVDRVVRQGVAYEFGPQGAVIGHLAGKRGAAVLDAPWAALLDLPVGAHLDALRRAHTQGLIDLLVAGNVVDVSFPMIDGSR